MSVKREISIAGERCTGCLNCQLICSFTFTRAFNPAAAYIKIERIDGGSEIHFTEDCTGCGLCIDYCAYGTLTFKEGVE